MFTSTRDHVSDGLSPRAGAEIYVMNPDGGDVTRLTDNESGDGFADLSPDGKRIVFDSDRLSGQLNVSDLFLMNADGTDQTFLTRGSSATWSPDCKNIAFHASASGTGTPTKPFPGASTNDSDIFVANVDDLVAGTGQPRNLTNTPDLIEDDAAGRRTGRASRTRPTTSAMPRPRGLSQTRGATPGGGGQRCGSGGIRRVCARWPCVRYPHLIVTTAGLG